jgi:hypothetical protein
MQQNDIVLPLNDNRYGALLIIDLLCEGLTLHA